MIHFLTNLDSDLLAVAHALACMGPVRAAKVRVTRLGDPSVAIPELVSSGSRVVIAHVLNASKTQPEVSRMLAPFSRAGIPVAFVEAGTPARPPENRAEMPPRLDWATSPPSSLVLEHHARAYLNAGGAGNLTAMFDWLAGRDVIAPEHLPDVGVVDITDMAELPVTAPMAVIVAYRSQVVAGDTGAIVGLVDALAHAGIRSKVVAVSSLRDGRIEALDTLLRGHDCAFSPDVLITMLSFSVDPVVTAEDQAPRTQPAQNKAFRNHRRNVLGSLRRRARANATPATQVHEPAFSRFGVPVFQVVGSMGTREAWQASRRGLDGMTTTLGITLPEVDGRIFAGVVAFREPFTNDLIPGARLTRLVADPERCRFVASQVASVIRLRSTRPRDRRIAILLHNASGHTGRIGSAVGLDAPESAVRLLMTLARQGYDLGPRDARPRSGDELIHALIRRGTWDDRWRDAPVDGPGWTPPGLQFGKVFIGIQPPRGWGDAAEMLAHDPELPAPPSYVAFYRWLRNPEEWGALAVIHLGKHGTLEWLPGKATGTSPNCNPERTLGPLPNIYPFLVSDPGEAAQAKRRSHAVTIGHLPPPLAMNGLSAALESVRSAIPVARDGHERGASVDKARLGSERLRLWATIEANHLDDEALATETGGTIERAPPASDDDEGWKNVEVRLAHYLHDLDLATTRAGLHILGQAPRGRVRAEFVRAIARVGSANRPGLEATGRDASGQLLAPSPPRTSALPGEHPRSDPTVRMLRSLLKTLDREGRRSSRRTGVRTVRRRIDRDDQGIELAVGRALRVRRRARGIHGSLAIGSRETRRPVSPVLRAIATRIWPALRQTPDELGAVTRVLDGRFIPPGPPGAPSRGVWHCLPTGRNLSTTDPRTLPTEAAWDNGRRMGDALLSRFKERRGHLPRTVGLVMWGTSAIRTGAEDVAQALWLLGVSPRWASGQVTGLEVIPLATLGRPRIDVVVRVSGFFRDAFPGLLTLLDDAFVAVKGTDEPLEMNAPRAHDTGIVTDGRIFGPRPGTYGSGLLPMIQHGSWSDADDLTDVYERWSAHSYGRTNEGDFNPDAFRRRFGQIDVAAKVQDNREHDILDSDDYFQDHGGMIATARRWRGPEGSGPVEAFVIDASDPNAPVARTVEEEVRRVVRTRVTHPTWLAAMARHGYRGASEVANSIEYAFGWGATTQSVPGWVYEDLARSCLLDTANRETLGEANPWAWHQAASRLLEAASRGIWDAPDPEVLKALTDAYLALEDDLEMR
ncbi:MAG: cobaltochelatase subunit CobN [Chloroflexi bacterium]|nr:cobaltochelatase subunit CobN [Chloroflexota bacterium]